MLRRVLAALVFILCASPAFADNVLVVVDLSAQTMQVRLNGETIHRWNVSSGRKGFATPTGKYRPIRMHKSYFSRKYDNAPMPYAIFFHGGYAIHGTTEVKRLGNRASHGCVRLLTDNARTLFQLVKQVGAGNTVIRVVS